VLTPEPLISTIPTSPTARIAVVRLRRQQFHAMSHATDQRRAASTSRSARPSRPSPARPRSSATGFVKLTNATKAVNRELEAKARALAGIKGYVANIADPKPEQVIGAYQRLFQIEKSFRMAKSDLAARPIFHHTKDSIEAHLTIVFAALAVSRWIEDTTGWSIKKFVKTIRRYRTIQIQAGEHVITAADPLPDDVHQIIEAVKTRAATH
jgi:hypothetical protein